MKKNIILFIIKFFDYFHQKKILKFLKEKKKISNFDTLIDVGAHLGETIEIYSKNFKIKKIYSFEPNIKNYKILKNKNFGNLNITIENIALGSNNTSVVIKQMQESSSSTIKDINENSKYFIRKKKLLFNDNLNIHVDQKITQFTLAKYVREKKINKIDFLKIDTEGYEFDVLKGANEILNTISLVIFEHHYDDMIKKGYKFKDIHKYLLINNFTQVFKIKMPFRKTFEYIYENKKKKY